jgi:uncharacterized protein YndB with AHSA1/START domain
MKKVHFAIDIQAPPERVWQAVVNVGPYEEWTSAFGAGSTFIGGWEKGAAIRFVSPEPDGGKTGIVAEIAESRRPEFLSIRTLGLIKHDVEDLTSAEARRWTPGYENYTLTPIAGGTRFAVDVDYPDEMAQMLAEMWPAALLKLKAVAERPA